MIYFDMSALSKGDLRIEKQSDGIVHVVYRTGPHKLKALWGLWSRGEMRFKKKGIYLLGNILNFDVTGNVCYYKIKYPTDL